MGGGGGFGRGLTPYEFEQLEQKAKQPLKKSGSTVKSNVFISFAAEDEKDVNMLRAQAKNEKSNIEFKDFSLKEPFDSNKAEYIKRGIRERIRHCSLTVVYLSDKTADSKWVDWEICESITLGKGVVAMYKGDKKPSPLPKAVLKHNVSVVPWGQGGLEEALRVHGQKKK